MRGDLMSDCAGSSGTTLQLWQLERAGEGTVLKVSDTVIGRLSPKLEESLREGWKLLLGKGLEEFVEKGTRA
jgi:hypothetical protein